MISNPNKNPFLNLGCGDKTHPDWVNIDFASANKHVLKLNILETLPYNDSSIKYIYHSHVLEHFTESDGIKFLTECYRILDKGGVLRIVLPDLENIINCYKKLITEKDSYNEIDFYLFHRWLIIELFDRAVREYPGGLMKECLYTTNPLLKEFMETRIGNVTVNEKTFKSKRKSLMFRIKRKLTKLILTKEELISLKIGAFRRSGEIHKWMYDKYSLTKLLVDCGFSLVEIKDPFTSSIPGWKSYEFDVKNNKILQPNSLFIEAIK